MPEEEKGSFKDPEELLKEKTTKKVATSKPSDVEAPLFKILNRIAGILEEEKEAIKENTRAVNALTTTLVSEIRKDRPTSRPTSMPAPIKNTVSEQSTNSEKQTEIPPLPLSTPTVPTWDAQTLFPQELASLLRFEDLGSEVKIAPKSFLGSDKFAKIASVVRECGGAYVSAGKDSHFKIPKPK